MSSEIKPFIDLEQFEKIKKFAQYFVDQKALPKGVDNAGKLVMLLQAGRDLWLSVTQTMSWLAIINGVVTVFGTVGATMIRRAGYDWKILESTATVCKISISKEWREAMEVQYLMEEAKHAGLTNSVTWQKYPQEMLFWKVLARARKRYCPEVMDWVALYEDYQELEKPENVQVIDSDQVESPLLEKINACQNVEELESLKGEIATSKDNTLIKSYAKKQVELKNKPLETTQPADDTTNSWESETQADALVVGEQDEAVW